MLKVKTTVKPSPIHGLGLFADEDIPKGTVIWSFDIGLDRMLSAYEILSASEPIQRFLVTHAWRSKAGTVPYAERDNSVYILEVGFSLFTNHSEHNYNCTSVPNYSFRHFGVEDTVALRDIKCGEEILERYSDFEDTDSPNDVLAELEAKFGINETLI